MIFFSHGQHECAQILSPWLYVLDECLELWANAGRRPSSHVEGVPHEGLCPLCLGQTDAAPGFLGLQDPAIDPLPTKAPSRDLPRNHLLFYEVIPSETDAVTACPQLRRDLNHCLALFLYQEGSEKVLVFHFPSCPFAFCHRERFLASPSRG